LYSCERGNISSELHFSYLKERYLSVFFLSYENALEIGEIKSTDMTDFVVSPKKQEKLDKKFEKQRVMESDIEERVLRRMSEKRHKIEKNS
jgi:hypothetical protein